MKSLLIATSLIFLSIFNGQVNENSMEGEYYGNGQICYFSYAIDKKWKLTLKEDNSFEFNKSTYDSRTKVTITDKLLGTWTMMDDSTLVLKNFLKLTESFCPSENIVYKVKGSKLYTTFSCFDYFAESKEYLEFLEQRNLTVKSSFIKND